MHILFPCMHRGFNMMGPVSVNVLCHKMAIAILAVKQAWAFPFSLVPQKIEESALHLLALPT